MPERRYGWNARAGRYIDRRGRFVSRQRVRLALDGALDAAEREVLQLADQLRNRQISLRAWELAMREQVKNISLYSATAAKGGWAQMSQADYGRVGQHVREQYEYLRRFGRQIASGEQPLDGRFANRMRMYAREGRALFHRTEEAEARIRGMVEKRNIRYPGDSCDGCLAAERAGWIAIDSDEVPEIGSRTCRSNCRCRWEFRSAQEAAEAA